MNFVYSHYMYRQCAAQKLSSFGIHEFYVCQYFLHGVHNCHETKKEFDVDFIIFNKPENGNGKDNTNNHYTTTWKFTLVITYGAKLLNWLIG